MCKPHDDQTREVYTDKLLSGMTLVGDSGGLSVIFGDALRSQTLPGLMLVETEHGPLYLDPDHTHTVLS